MVKNKQNIEILSKIDAKDKKILAILSKNSRETLTNIAKQVNLSIDSVRMRIKKMQESGVITGFTILRSYKSLGYVLRANILIKLQNIMEEKIDDFISFLKKQERIIILNSVAGNFDVEMVVIAKSSSDLDKFSKMVRIKFTDIIADWQTNLITESYKIEEFELQTSTNK